MNRIELTESELVIHLSWFARPAAFLSSVPRRFPLADVEGAAFDPAIIRRLNAKWNGPELPGFPGGGWTGPGSFDDPWAPSISEFFAGVPIQTSGDVGRFRTPTRDFGFYVYSDPRRIITITIRSGPYRMFVLDVEDPQGTVARIEYQLGRLRGQF